MACRDVSKAEGIAIELRKLRDNAEVSVIISRVQDIPRGFGLMRVGNSDAYRHRIVRFGEGFRNKLPHERFEVVVLRLNQF